MGISTLITGALTGGLGLILGGMGGSEKPVQTPQSVQPADTKSAAEVAAENDKKRQAALIASNAGNSNGQTTVGGGNADVTRKVLLGL